MEDKEVLDQIGRVYMWASTMIVFLMVAGFFGCVALTFKGA